MTVLLVATASILGFGAATAFAYGLVCTLRDGGSRLLESHDATHQAALRELSIRALTARQVTALTALSALSLGALTILITGAPFLGALAVVAGLLVPKFAFEWLRWRRRARFEEQFPDALGMIANSARAGLSLPQALDEAAQRAPAPVGEELLQIVQDHRLGTELGKCLRDARARLRSRGFNLASTALQVNRDRGGDLPQALDTMAASLKEIWRLEQKLVTASAEGRRAVWVISGMPLFIFIMMALFDPSIPELLLTRFFGFILLIVAILLYGFGFWWLMRVLRIDV